VKSDQTDPDVAEETLHVTARDGYELSILVFKPSRTKTAEDEGASESPLIVLYFPGGFIYGHPRTMAPLARPLVKLFNAVVVAPSHRLAPEHPFPASVHDGWDAFTWIADNAASLGANPSKGFIVGGISSGANISNAVAHIARDNANQIPITGVWLCCSGARVAPKLAEKLPEKYRSRYLSRTQEECINPPASSPGHEKFKEGLKPDLDSELYSPLIWPTDAGHEGFGHSRFPKTYFQVCGMEPSRDEVLIFDDMLKGEGIPTRLDMYPGLPHAFWLSYPSLAQAKQVQKDIMAGFAWLLAT
jgi:acetyl esterase/lipase